MLSENSDFKGEIKKPGFLDILFICYFNKLWAIYKIFNTKMIVDFLKIFFDNLLTLIRLLTFSSSSSALSLGSPGSSGRWSRPGSAGEDDDEPDTWRATLPVLEDTTETESSTRLGRNRNGSVGMRSRTPSEERKNKGLSELDRKVEQAARAARKQCRCESEGTEVDAKTGVKCVDKLKVRRLGGGKYNIAGRNVFVRVSLVTKYIIFI